MIGTIVESRTGMVNLDVTCPETVRPETIGALIDTDGEILLVLRCTRFDPPAAMTCSETCRQIARASMPRCSCSPR